MSLIKSELRKVLYVRANWGILVAAIVISIISVVITPFIFEAGNVGAGLTLDSPQAIDGVYANAISGYIFVIILGHHADGRRIPPRHSRRHLPRSSKA